MPLLPSCPPLIILMYRQWHITFYASDLKEWQLVRDRLQHPDVGFQDAVHMLLDKTQSSEAQCLLSRLSPLASFILLQALIQRLCLLRQLSTTGNTSLRGVDIEELE